MHRSSLVLVISACLVIGACGGGAAETRDPGEVAAQYQGPIQSSDVEHGQVLYQSICMSCHGGGAPALEGIGWEPGAMRQKIREGGERMPAISESRLSNADMEAILAYMTTIGGVNGEVTVGGPGAVPADGEPIEGEPAAEGEEAF